MEPRRFYVYRLIDPRSGKPFYIGKGTGRRAYTHEARARRGHIDNAEKFKAIRAIHESGEAVVVEFVAKGMTENEAFAMERELIESTPGLCNIVGGCVTNEDKAITTAKDALSRLKTYREWISTTDPSRLAACERVMGSLRGFYEEFIESLLRLSGASESERERAMAAAFF